jgi:hypothetical protein
MAGAAFIADHFFFEAEANFSLDNSQTAIS